MKLKNFLADETFNALRKEMRAELIDFEIDFKWTKLNSDKFLKDLQTVGIDVSLDDIEFFEDGTIEYNGKKVILYIRDAFVDPEYYNLHKRAQNKFHVAQCRTIDGFIKNAQINRYVVSTRTDGVFLVNLFNSRSRTEILAKEIESELDVCKNCLTTLNYQKYKQANREDKKAIYTKFSLETFFNLYQDRTHHIKTPKYNEYTSPLNVYDDNFSFIAEKFKESKNWICEGCGLDLADNPKFLHAHHKDRNKANNSIHNLKALCIGCHAAEPFHDSMKRLPEYERFKIIYGR